MYAELAGCGRSARDSRTSFSRLRLQAWASLGHPAAESCPRCPKNCHGQANWPGTSSPSRFFMKNVLATCCQSAVTSQEPSSSKTVGPRTSAGGARKAGEVGETGQVGMGVGPVCPACPVGMGDGKQRGRSGELGRSSSSTSSSTMLPILFSSSSRHPHCDMHNGATFSLLAQLGDMDRSTNTLGQS